MTPSLQFALLGFVMLGGWVDLRTRTIPNWLNIGGLVLGFGMNAFFLGMEGFKVSLAGFGLALLVYLPLYFVRAMGAGDVKFMAAIGAMLGPQNWLAIFFTTAILGGIASLCLIVARGRFYLTLTNVSTIAGELLRGRMPFEKDPSLDIHDKRSVGLPHGTLIAISVGIFLGFIYEKT